MALGRLALGGFVIASLIALAPACSSTASVTDLYTALDSEGNRKRNVFYTDTLEIHCVGEVGSSRPDATFQVRIRQVQRFDFPTGQFRDADRILGPAPEFVFGETQGVSKLDVVLGKIGPDGAPADDGNAPFLVGRFQCEILLDGNLEKTAVFNIEFPPCPDGEIVPLKSCAGFFELGKVCPQFGISSTEKTFCTCDYAKGWQCDP